MGSTLKFPKNAKLESGTVHPFPPQEGGPGVPPTLTSSSTPDENRVGTGSTTATDRQSSASLAVVPWPIPPPALIEHRVSPPREIIFDEIHQRPAGAANQRRRPRPPNVPNALPVRAPALVRDPILPDRDIIFEEIRDGPVGAENQRPRPRNVPNPLAIPAPALVGDQILPDIIFDGIHEGQAGAANQRRRPRRRNVHRPPNFVHPLNRRPGTPPPPDFFSVTLAHLKTRRICRLLSIFGIAS